MNSIDILNLLEQHGVMPTAQRLEIANILLSRPQHLSADQIIESGTAMCRRQRSTTR